MDGGEEPNTKLYVKGLPGFYTEQQVIALFGQYGAVTSTKSFPPPAGKSDATALVRMGTLQDAQLAMQALNGALIGDPPVPPMLVRYHGPLNAPPSEKLYIKGLLPVTTEAMLRTTFSVFGLVEFVRVMQPRPPATDCTALVKYGSVLEATTAMQAFNGTSPPGHTPQVQILVRFADDAKTKEDKKKRTAQLMPPDAVPALAATPHTQTPAAMPTLAAMPALAMMPHSQFMMSPTAAYQPMAYPASPTMTGFNSASPLVLQVQYFGGPGAHPTHNLEVTGLPTDITQAEVQAAFQSCGIVHSVQMMPPGDKQSTAVVRMGSVEEATLAISVLHNIPLNADGTATASASPEFAAGVPSQPLAATTDSVGTARFAPY